MYYATFKGIKKGDIAEFRTKQERDDWVNFKDDFSVFVDNAPDNCVFERMALEDEDVINSVVNDKTMPTIQDDFLPYVKWYLRSIA